MCQDVTVFFPVKYRGADVSAFALMFDSVRFAYQTPSLVPRLSRRSDLLEVKRCDVEAPATPVVESEGLRFH